jgi:hypothetical protein
MGSLLDAVTGADPWYGRTAVQAATTTASGQETLTT